MQLTGHWNKKSPKSKKKYSASFQRNTIHRMGSENQHSTTPGTYNNISGTQILVQYHN
jgi:hypothetical protein